jgi:hypothetical protein
LIVDSSITFSADDQSVPGHGSGRAHLSAIARLLDLLTPVGLERDRPGV